MKLTPRGHCTRVDSRTRQEPARNLPSSRSSHLNTHNLTIVEPFQSPERFVWSIDDDGAIVVKGGA